MINIGPYVKPIELKPAVITAYNDPCQNQRLACAAANADLSKYFFLYNSTQGTANASGTTASGINGGRVVFTIGYPADMLNISYNWMELSKNQNNILAENLKLHETPPVMNNRFIDRIELEIA